MDPLIIQSQLRSITGPEAIDGMRLLRPEAPALQGAHGPEGPSFSEVLAESIGKVNALQNQADTAIEQLATGQTADIHQTLLAVQKAEISMRMLMEVRNRIVSAYQEVMRTQV